MGAVIVLTAAVAAIWMSSYGVQPGLVGLGLTYALTVRHNFYSNINLCRFICGFIPGLKYKVF